MLDLAAASWPRQRHVRRRKCKSNLRGAMRELLVVFGSVFLAELGDKTQIATLIFAADERASAWGVFAAAALALILATALAVLLGTAAERWLAFVPLKLVAGIAFVAIGAWTIAEHFRWV
jgi:putative Ca2+/H+ antiporter (TMEM165/GDT1 family)